MKILHVIYDVCSFDIVIYHVFCDNVNWQSITSFKKMSKLTWHGLFSRMIRIIKNVKMLLSRNCLSSDAIVFSRAWSVLKLCQFQEYVIMHDTRRCLSSQDVVFFCISIRITDSVIRICSMSTGTHWNSEQQTIQTTGNADLIYNLEKTGAMLDPP